ncbi:hypothetical protein [Candidatus Thiodiazotropha sp. CDECU1]|uniref:hypothetical protein n=1 Tax=Candidatus Thiodiazotropha sp. CDECU1 TaxID=3065865 RepID=UPI002930E0AC|nr:hypothetical protein [Candidatus Thiodiazotropha sp. CDECU1]
MELISRSIRIVNEQISLLLLSGVIGIQFYYGAFAYISVVGMLASIVIGIIIYGQITIKVRGEEVLPAKEILKRNWVNYIVVMLIIGVSTLAIIQVIKILSTSAVFLALSQSAIKTLMSIITIYVLPIVFLKKEHMLAIVTGLVFLFQNIRKSIPLILLAGLIFIVEILLGQILVQQGQQSTNVYSLVPTLIVINIVVTYISFLIYTAATLVLIPNSNVYVDQKA